jgi:hypothetical protein
MSLSIYLQPDPDTAVSQDGFFTNPFPATFDGRTGGYKEIKLYIRNDDDNFYYHDVELKLEDSQFPSVTNRPEDGFVWKLSYGDTKPTYNDWLNTAPANILVIPDTIGAPGNPDISTYLPFWVFIQVPGNLDIQVFTSVQLVLSGKETLA